MFADMIRSNEVFGRPMTRLRATCSELFGDSLPAVCSSRRDRYTQGNEAHSAIFPTFRKVSGECGASTAGGEWIVAGSALHG